MTVPPSPRHPVTDPGSDDADALAQTGSPRDEQQEVRRVAERPGQVEAGPHGRLEGSGRINSECSAEVETVDDQLEGAGGQVAAPATTPAIRAVRQRPVGWRSARGIPG
jgi:hypothetical protein